jgi:hypothetical protein
MLQKDIETINFPLQNESIVCKGFIQSHDNRMEKMYVEDLAALEPLSDDALLEEIKNRLKLGETYSFVGDVLLSMNPNKQPPVYDRKVKLHPAPTRNLKVETQNLFSSTVATCSNLDPTIRLIFSRSPTAHTKT